MSFRKLTTWLAAWLFLVLPVMSAGAPVTWSCRTGTALQSEARFTQPAGAAGRDCCRVAADGCHHSAPASPAAHAPADCVCVAEIPADNGAIGIVAAADFPALPVERLAAVSWGAPRAEPVHRIAEAPPVRSRLLTPLGSRAPPARAAAPQLA